MSINVTHPCERRTTQETLKSGLYAPYERDGKRITEIIRFNPLEIFLICIVPSLSGTLSSIVMALVFHNDEISNYNWQCGRARFPSLSRIINLPFERTIWQLVVLYHAPMRCVELVTGYTRYKRLRSVTCPNVTLYEWCRHAYFWLGVAELSLMVAISLVGEREHIKIHVIFFYLFGMLGLGFFVTNLYCHRYSLYYLRPYGVLCFRLKLLFTILYVCSAPVLFASFILYWKACITVAYDVFAITEYAGVVLNVAYHSLVFFDIRHKVTFSVRRYESVDKRKDTEDNAIIIRPSKNAQNAQRESLRLRMRA